jgi:hypothetical protein
MQGVATIADIQNSGMKTDMTVVIQFQFHWTWVLCRASHLQFWLHVMCEQYIYHAAESTDCVNMETVCIHREFRWQEQ